ncbi:gem-associated protein 6 [Anabrus simplex]|uniref:gem-associated protein 6 n=1 Tax=Anabrus simplex TaxID=316456 RepID=UPI0034DDBC6D
MDDKKIPDHGIFKNNPIYLKSFVQKFVELITINGESHTGTVYTIDPVSESVILLKKNNDVISMDIIMGHAVKSLAVKSGVLPVEPDEVFPSESAPGLSKEEINELRNKLKDWLCKNRLPIEEDGEILRLQGVLEIHPPYGINQCVSGNEIILGRVQQLITIMPTSVSHLEP